MTSLEENPETPPPGPQPPPLFLPGAPGPRPTLPRHDTYVTTLLCLINFGVFILMRIFDNTPQSGEEGAHWIAFGSMNGYHFLSGDWWRPLTAAFLHIDLPHLVSNMLFLWFFGRAVERALGHAGFFLLYLTAAIVAAPIALMDFNTWSIGASAAVFGLAAAFWVLYFPTLRRLPRLPRRIYYGMTGLLILISLPLPRLIKSIDLPNLAHLIGAVAGGLCALPVALWPRRVPRARRWRLQAALALAAAAIVLAPLALYPNPQKLFSHAQLAYEREDYAQAIADSDRFIRAFPRYGMAYIDRARCHSALGQYNLAAADYDMAVKVDPQHPGNYLSRAGFYLTVGQPAMVFSDINAAASRGVRQNHLAAYYGHYYLEEGNFLTAIAELTYAIDYGPPSVAAYARYNRGLAYFAGRQYDQAEADWRESARLRKTPKTQAGSLEDIGFIYLARSQWQQALNHTDTVKAVYADKPYNLLVRAIAADRLGRPDLAPAPALLKDKLRKEYAWELKLLLAPGLYHCYEDAVR